MAHQFFSYIEIFLKIVGIKGNSTAWDMKTANRNDFILFISCKTFVFVFDADQNIIGILVASIGKDILFLHYMLCD